MPDEPRKQPNLVTILTGEGTREATWLIVPTSCSSMWTTSASES
jgi:hypothetical protein